MVWNHIIIYYYYYYNKLTNQLSNLEYLNITTTGITLTGATKLFNFFYATNSAADTIEALKFGYNKLKKDNIFVELLKNAVIFKKLAFLDFRFCEISKDGIKEVNSTSYYIFNIIIILFYYY